MLISYLWLKELVDFDLSPEELAHTLTGLGLETVIRDDRRGWHKDIVIGLVKEVILHPNADKLRICTVDAGGVDKKIVCGAPNVAAGQFVPVALPGTVLPDGLKIEPRKVRGEFSEGMICSEAELKLSEDHDGIMVLEGKLKPGEKLADRFEVCDVILETDLTPNRGDCLNMIGIAREVSAAVGGSLKKPTAPITESNEDIGKSASVEITAPEFCPRYTARMIKGVKVGPSPFWMRRRLMALGVRPINNIVDITNYVLMETGHPLHAFDHSEIRGSKIIVRKAGDGERFTTLDGKERTLNPGNLVIADGERAVALAGVMGGLNSEVKATTRDVLLEAAFFAPSCIRRTAKALGISSESSYRFERGTDVEGLLYASDRATSLLQTLGGGEVSKGRVDVYPNPVSKKVATLRFARLNSILGITVGKEIATGILQRLELDVKRQDENSVTVEVPHFRFDLEREIDLIEEVARHNGYDKLITSIPQVAAGDVEEDVCFNIRRVLRRHLRAIGMYEGVRYTFISLPDLDKIRLSGDHPLRAVVPIDNPLSSEWTHMRPTLIPGLVSSAREAVDMRFFEIGKVFAVRGKGEAPSERWKLGGMISEIVKTGIWSGRAGKRDFYHLKGVVQSVLDFLGIGGVCALSPSDHPFYYPKRQSDIIINGRAVGHFGQIHPETLESYSVPQEIFVFEIDLDGLAAVKPAPKIYSQLSRFPSVKRDIALVVDTSVTCESLIYSIRSHGAPYAREVEAFDIYRGERLGADKKSLAFFMEFRDDTRTLTDEEADRIFEKIVVGVKEDCGAQLRA
ncbi:MAG: phenylalanine--tRNA ligase subunit beta [Nitrospinae bacterium]|nr:phenylalanine--tRNA ligase subunit beta [Nitrospinota bacterium]MBF0634012.1 phenylalanine--tRNA ligase subunit beta [Nitrospinota bacterium]